MSDTVNKYTLDKLVADGQLSGWRMEPSNPDKYQTDELFLTFPNGYTLAIGCQPTGYDGSGAAIIIE